MLFYVLPCLCQVTDEELIRPDLFEAHGMELWRTGIKPEHCGDSDSGKFPPLKLKCDNQEILSALAAARDSPLMEDCGSDTRSITHHVCDSCCVCVCVCEQFPALLTV